MVAAGLPHAQIMIVSGHTESSTFRRYVSADDDAIKRAGQALDAWHAIPTEVTQSDYEPQTMKEVGTLIKQGLKSFSEQAISSLTSFEYLMTAWGNAFA